MNDDVVNPALLDISSDFVLRSFCSVETSMMSLFRGDGSPSGDDPQSFFLVLLSCRALAWFLFAEEELYGLWKAFLCNPTPTLATITNPLWDTELTSAWLRRCLALVGGEREWERERGKPYDLSIIDVGYIPASTILVIDSQSFYC